MKTTYLTLTIGPVTDTLLQQRATREMWAASYLFSYIIRETIRTACDVNSTLNKTKPIPPGNILLPVLQADIEGEYTYGAGLYPDRIFIKADDPGNDADRLNQAVTQVLANMAKEMANVWANEADEEAFKAEVKFITDYLDNYLRINILKNELEDGQNIVTTITPYLDASELYARILKPEAAESRNPLATLFTTPNESESFLRKAAFGGKRPPGVERQRGFDSLMEISTRELEFANEANYKKALAFKDVEADFIAKLKSEFGDKFMAYHKYVAVVHADGDNVGKIVGKVAKDPEQLKAFSGRLRDFAVAATKAVYEYGGAPVYSGGDDLLFFAPVACKYQGQEQLSTIFQLLGTLDGIFEDKLVGYAKSLGIGEAWKDGQREMDEDGNPAFDKHQLPSLSYGLSISFYKYPLYEAKTTSFGLMEAIKHDGEKNGIGVKFLKHSGHAIAFTLHKHRKETYEVFLELLRNHLPNDSNFLNSLTYKMDVQRVLLSVAAKNAVDDNDEQKLTDFFKNNFNEVWSSHGPFFQGLIPFIMALYKESTPDERLFKDDKPEHQDWLKVLYATLRFIHFLKSKDADDEQ